MAAKSRRSVIIVGAGPVGLLTALRLGQAGISTLVLEAHKTLLPTTRAMVYMPAILPVLENLGILETVKQHAFLNEEGIVWRDETGKFLAQMPLGSSVPGQFGGVLLIGQVRMNALILEELKKYPSVEVRFGLRCVGIDNPPSADFVKVMVSEGGFKGEDLFFEADYLLGTDGANSTVRRTSCIPFEGYTWQDFKMMGCDVWYDFKKENGYNPMNFIVHPELWCVIIYAGQDDQGQPYGTGTPLWRISYVEPSDLPDSREEQLARAHKRIPKYLKGSPDYKMSRAEPYILHQRCAAQAKKGRVMLAGDALHSNNPIGGLGLTGGILDAFAYGNAFTRVLKGGEPDPLLTDCADSRRDAWLNTTNHMSTTNLRRLQSTTAEDVKARKDFFQKLETDQDFPKMLRKGMDKMMPESFQQGTDELVKKVQHVSLH